MYSLLIKVFVKDRELNNPVTRRTYGIIGSILGICLNIFLFVGKYLAGTICGSIAITADAINNLSDAGSSFVSLMGFKLAGKKPDADHPYGHGRFEYISGFIVSGFIMFMSYELLKSSVGKIIKPTEVDTSSIVIIILIASICVKLYMYAYNMWAGKRIDSATMKATAIDSLSDSVATLVVLITTVITGENGYNIDGYAGVLVSMFIMLAGYNAAKETLSPLLGQAPKEEYVDEIKRIVLSYEEIVGIHDLMVHDYGPGRVFVSLHGEVSGAEDIYVLHDAIDRIEQELGNKLGCEAVIHMDPIDVNDEKVSQAKKQVIDLIRTYNTKLSIHDFRLVTGNTHTNMLFDVLVPIEEKRADSDIKKDIEALIKETWENYCPVIKIDRAFTREK